MAESIATRHENWERVVWGLLYVKEGLQGFVDVNCKQQYQTFMNKANVTCQNQTCDQCQVNSKCPNGRNKVLETTVLWPNHFCDAMNKEIRINHIKNKPFWMNTDSTKWHDPHVGYWEVAKCYLSTSGYFDKTGPNQVDASGLISISLNSWFMRQHIRNIWEFEEVRDIRNKTLHDAHYELDGQTADDCLDKMITVLEDPNELIHDTFAKQAANHIRKIKAKTEKTPAVMTNIDGDKSLKVIEGLMYDMILERSNVDDLRQRLAKYYQKHLNSAPISPFLSDKDENLEKFYVPPKIVQKDHRKVEKDEGTPMTTYRHLFCKMGEFRKNVFMVGEAGIGKSSCAAMCAIKWANQFSSTKSIKEPYKNTSEQTSFEAWELCLFNSDLKDIFLSETKQEDQFQDESFFKEIEFLFHLTLRDNCDVCDLTDMVRDQLISRIYQRDERVAAYSTLNSVLFNKNCVIIADGLDEWTHPNETNCSCSDEHKVIPYLPPTIDATVLITSRPWRMSQQRVKDTKIDSFLEIEGTTDIRLLIQKVLDCLNETVTENKTLLDFVKFVDRMELTRLLSVPIISMLLVCLWFEGMHDSFSLCDIYAYTIEMMFGRKDLLTIIPQYTSIHFPRCFQRTEYIQKYYNILMEMAQLAFTTLFSNDKTSSLVFKKVNCLVGDHLLFVLKTGILQETKSASLIKKSSSYSFIHKTVQEFLAAIYMSYHPKEFHRVVLPFYEKNGNLSDVSQVFIFISGLNISLANEMSAMISNGLSLDDMHFWLDTRVIDIQSTIVSGYKEAQSNQMLDIQLSLYSFALNASTDSEIISDLLSKNKYEVRYIKTGSIITQKKLQEVFISSSNTLTNVQILGMAGHFNLSPCSRLQYLSINESETSDIEVNSNTLVSLHLQCVSKTVEYKLLQSFEQGLNCLKRLNVASITNVSLLCQTVPKLTHLERLYISSIDFGDHALLLPASVNFVYLREVAITARSLGRIVVDQESNTSLMKCILSNCTVEPKSEYNDIKPYIQTRDELVSPISDG